MPYTMMKPQKCFFLKSLEHTSRTLRHLQLCLRNVWVHMTVLCVWLYAHPANTVICVRFISPPPRFSIALIELFDILAFEFLQKYCFIYNNFVPVSSVFWHKIKQQNFLCVDDCVLFVAFLKCQSKNQEEERMRENVFRKSLWAFGSSLKKRFGGISWEHFQGLFLPFLSLSLPACLLSFKSGVTSVNQSMCVFLHRDLFSNVNGSERNLGVMR